MSNYVIHARYLNPLLVQLEALLRTIHYGFIQQTLKLIQLQAEASPFMQPLPHLIAVNLNTHQLCFLPEQNQHLVD